MIPTRCRAYFTTKTANQTLPLVSRIVGDIVVLSQEVNETQSRLAFLTNGRDPSEVNEYTEELEAIKQNTDEKSLRLNSFYDELLDLSIDPTSAEEGYADFPALRGEQEVCLCWKLGEPEVMYWHAMGEECSRRRLVDLPIVQSALAD